MTKKLTPFLKPNEVLSETEVDYLKEKSDFNGITLLFHAWFIIGLSVLVYSLFPNIFTFLAAVLVIAGRQLGLAILMHEGAHGLITNNTKLNNSLSQWICAFPVWSDTYGYRHYHLAHHRNTQLEDDPDLSLSKPFPVEKKSMLRKVLRDIFGVSGLVQRYELIFKTLLKSDTKKNDGKKISGFESRNTLYGILIFASICKNPNHPTWVTILLAPHIFVGRSRTQFWINFPISVNTLDCLVYIGRNFIKSEHGS